MMRRKMRFQSTLPQGERPILPEREKSFGIFNPRSRKGSDLIWITTPRANANFNPRSRKGSDRVQIVSGRNVETISIHAPARGATYDRCKGRAVTENFNPRSRKGSDEKPEVVITKVEDFNPRSRKGSDWAREHGIAVGPDFNPRSRKGSDRDSERRQEKYYISIHAPARGATVLEKELLYQYENFNPRSRKGSDRASLSFINITSEFQSTLPQGERHTGFYILFLLIPFQSTLPQGERP